MSKALAELVRKRRGRWKSRACLLACVKGLFRQDCSDRCGERGCGAGWGKREEKRLAPVCLINFFKKEIIILGPKHGEKGEEIKGRVGGEKG